MPRRRANGHWQNRITTQGQVDTSPRDNGRVIPWRNIVVVMVTLLMLLLCICTYLVLELRATRLDLAGKLQKLDVCEAEQLRLRQNLAARDLELAETKRELLRCDQHLHTCGSLTDQLNKTAHGIAHGAAEALNERDAAVKREQHQTDLLLACETNRREELNDRLGDAKLENAERKAREKERRRRQQHSGRGDSEVQAGGLGDMAWKVAKAVGIWTVKKVFSFFGF